MSLRNRLRRLEGGDERCSECGGPWQPGDEVEYLIEWEDPPTEAEIQELRRWYEAGMPEEESPPEPEDEYCSRCGRQTLYVIDWPDAPHSEARRELRRLEAEMLARRGWDTTFLGLEPKEEGAAPWGTL